MGSLLCDKSVIPPAQEDALSLTASDRPELPLGIVLRNKMSQCHRSPRQIEVGEGGKNDKVFVPFIVLFSAFPSPWKVDWRSSFSP